MALNTNLSGTFDFDPSLGGIVVGAFSRCGIRRTELTVQHMKDAEFEANLVFSDWQGDGLNTWQVELVTQDIIAGVGRYEIPNTTVFTLDIYIRQNNQEYGYRWANANGAIEVWANSSESIMRWGPSPGYDPYDAAGVPLDPIPPVPPSPPFPTPPNAIDRILIPISRSDYAAIANKGMTGFPTSCWIDRLLQPVMYLWPVPNQTIPGGLQYYVQKRSMDSLLMNGSQQQMPFEAYDAFVWCLAERLAFIYAPDKVPMIGPRKELAYRRMLQATTENVPINLDVSVKSYFRV